MAAQPRSDLAELAAALREQRVPVAVAPWPTVPEWESGTARVPEERLRKTLEAHQHAQATRTQGWPYIALPEFAKAVGAAVLPAEKAGRKARKRKAPGAVAGAPAAYIDCTPSSPEDRQNATARHWVQKFWKDQKDNAIAKGWVKETDQDEGEMPALGALQVKCAPPFLRFRSYAHRRNRTLVVT